jgi:hypothetical protein
MVSRGTGWVSRRRPARALAARDSAFAAALSKYLSIAEVAFSRTRGLTAEVFSASEVADCNQIARISGCEKGIMRWVNAKVEDCEISRVSMQCVLYTDKQRLSRFISTEESCNSVHLPEL